MESKHFIARKMFTRPTCLVLALALLHCGARRGVAADSHWLGTWACGPQLTEPGNLPPVALANTTLRQYVHTTLGGQHLRVRFSNAYGNTSVTIQSAHVALASGSGSAGSGTINTATDKALTFHGAPSVVIPPGEVIYCDIFDFNLPALTNLAVSIYFGNISATTINGHPGSRTTSFIKANNVVSAANMAGASTTQHWYIITGVDVQANTSTRAVVTFGDSITDGRGSDTDGNDRWPDNLAQRLFANAATTNVAVLNQGIGGGGIFGGLGPPGLSRFDRDVLSQSGVRWMILFEGVNDIGGDSNGTIGTNLVAAYKQMITKAHARNVLVYGATITPFGANSYYSVSHEASRQTVNAWIRTNTVADGAIDFDTLVRDPANQINLLSAYDSGDGLHLNPTGYQVMVNAIDLSFFTH